MTSLVANPEEDQVEVLDLPAHTLNTRPGTPIPVGDFPVDVTVVNKQGDPAKPRAYVVNRTDQTVTEIDLDTLLPGPFDIGLGPGTNKYAVALAARSDGQRLYTANWVDQTVSVIDLADVSVWDHDINTTFATNEGFPTRLVLLRLPE